MRLSSLLALGPWLTVGACSSTTPPAVAPAVSSASSADVVRIAPAAPPTSARVPASAVASTSAPPASSERASPPPPPAPSASSQLPPPLPPSAPGAPGLTELLGRLRPLASRRFDRAAQDRGCPADTLGTYVSTLVSEGTPNQSPPDTLRRLSASCGDFPVRPAPIDPPASRAHWYCVLDAFVSDIGGDVLWHYELRMRVRRSDGAIDTTHLSCPGTP